MSDITKTPREELECKKKYLYEYSMFWECKEHSKNQILEEDVCDLLNKFSSEIEELGISIALFEDDVQVKDKKIDEQQATISALKEENEQLRRLFEEMKQPITINLTEEDEKELRKLLGLIDDE